MYSTSCPQYEFETVPEETEAPENVSNVAAILSPHWFALFGLMFGILAAVPIVISLYCWNAGNWKRETACRNLIYTWLVMGLAAGFVLTLHKMGTTQKLYEGHVGFWGSAWFGGLVVFPITLAVFAFLVDAALRGRDSMLLGPILAAKGWVGSNL